MSDTESGVGLPWATPNTRPGTQSCPGPALLLGPMALPEEEAEGETEEDRRNPAGPAQLGWPLGATSGLSLQGQSSGVVARRELPLVSALTLGNHMSQLSCLQKWQQTLPCTAAVRMGPFDLF